MLFMFPSIPELVIVSLEFGVSKSPDLLHVIYCRNVRARGPVEQWLCSVEQGMFDTVKK